MNKFSAGARQKLTYMQAFMPYPRRQSVASCLIMPHHASSIPLFRLRKVTIWHGIPGIYNKILDTFSFGMHGVETVTNIAYNRFKTL